MAALPPPGPPIEALQPRTGLAYALIWAQANFLRLFAPIPALKDVLPDDIDVVPTSIPSRQPGRTIRATIYRHRSVAQPSGKRVLNWHGSGFLLRRFGEDKSFCAFLAGQLRDQGVEVVDMDYRKAPEDPYPAAVDDAEDAILHFASLDDTTHLVTTGFSAGGMLAVSATASTKPVLAARREGKVSVNATAVFYPPSDLRPTARRVPPCPKPRSGIVLPGWVGRIMTTSFLPDPNSTQSKRVTLALLTPDELPPHLLIICGAADSLHDESLDFINELNAASPPHPDAKFVSIDDEGHAWDKAPSIPASIEAQQYAYKQALEYVKKGLAA